MNKKINKVLEEEDLIKEVEDYINIGKLIQGDIKVYMMLEKLKNENVRLRCVLHDAYKELSKSDCLG